MTDLLLLGKSGQLGHAVERQASASGISCTALDRGQLDVTERDAVLEIVERLRPSAVVNAAAYTAVDQAEEDQDAAFAVNERGAAHIAEACENIGAPVFHVSTDYVFDGRKEAPYEEDDPAAPLNIYGQSKLAGEEAVRKNCPRRHVILRTSWLYGLEGHNFVKTMLRLGSREDTLRVVDDQFGNPTFADDLAGAVLSLAGRLSTNDRPQEGFGTFHYAGQGTVTWCGFARAIFELTAPQTVRHPQVVAIRSKDYQTSAKRPTNSTLDCSRLQRVHGIVSREWRTALAEALGEMLRQPHRRNGVTQQNGRVTQ